MGRTCDYPGCSNKDVPGSCHGFHRFPVTDVALRELWLVALGFKLDTKLAKMKKLRVCSAHFSEEDYVSCPGHRKKRDLKRSAVPAPQVQDNWAEINTPQDQFTGTQLNLSEMCASTTEKQTPQHIVDEEAILQLMKNCPKCNRTCRCTKHTRGSYLIAYQKCYFCDYQRKWASQPEAKNINIHKASTPHKRKPPKDKVSVNAKAQTSQLNKNISASSSPTTQ